MTLPAHSKDWYERLAKLQAGYYYPWKSKLPPLNGEDTYRDLVFQHLFPQADVLDAGCGHGDFTLEIAPYCRSVLAYDRVAAYIQLAQESARQRGVGNVRFIHADSSSEANGGKPRLPAEALSFDLLISRRGPVNWIEDARRVARPGAVLIQLNPEVGPPPSWNDELPQPLRLPPPPDWTMRAVILSKLEAGGLSLHSSWSFDVPETFPNPEELYIHLAWGFAPGEVPAYREVHRELEAVFHRHASSLGLDLRFRCFLWKAVVD